MNKNETSQIELLRKEIELLRKDIEILKMKDYGISYIPYYQPYIPPSYPTWEITWAIPCEGTTTTNATL